jgi:rfaE bifunctional protein kinase chain/domain
LAKRFFKKSDTLSNNTSLILNSTNKKIIKLEDVSQVLGDTVVLCHGNFNIIHPGHIRYLDYAYQQGSELVVSIQGDSTFLDAERKHNFSEDERAIGVASLQTVSQVVLLGSRNLKYLIKKLRPKVLVLGKEFETEQYDQIDDAVKLLKKQGGKILFHAGETNYASTDLLRENLPDLEDQHIKQFKKSCSRQNLNLDEILKCINKFKEASLLVIGDTIIDQYVACEALGLSAEAPVVVVRELDTREYAGGAAVVSMHVSALGAKCRFISVVGKDDDADTAKKELDRLNVEHTLIEDDSRPTTFKIRYLVDNQKMFRVSRLKGHGLSKQIEERIIEEIRESATKVQGILISDFVYGVITPRILKTITELAAENSLFVFGDQQCSSQIGNISKFKNFDLICPTERESRIALATQDEGVEWVANTLMKKTNSRNLVMKLGGEGFIAYESEQDGFINRQHFPALCINPVDVAGAGDSLLAALSVGLCSGATLMQSAAIGTGMASLAVQQVGNVPVSYQQLKDYLNQL